MSRETNRSTGSLELTLLGILFITLKLCKVINWSWWWVLLPFYGSLLLAIPLCLTLLYYKRKENKYFDNLANKHKRKSKWELRLEELEKQHNEQSHGNN